MPYLKKIDGRYTPFFTQEKAAQYGEPADEIFEVSDLIAQFAQDENGIIELRDGLWQLPPPYVPTLDELKGQAHQALENQLRAVIMQGFTSPTRSFTLGCEESDQTAFTKYLTLINEGLSLSELELTTQMGFRDKAGVTHSLTVQEIKAMLFQYGVYLNESSSEFAIKKKAIDNAQTAEELEALNGD